MRVSIIVSLAFIFWGLLTFFVVKILKDLKEKKKFDDVVKDPEKIVEELNKNKFREKIGTEENEISFKVGRDGKVVEERKTIRTAEDVERARKQKKVDKPLNKKDLLKKKLKKKNARKKR